MNIKRCPQCQWPMKVMRVPLPTGLVLSLVCPECDHVEPLPVDQVLTLAKTPRLL